MTDARIAARSSVSTRADLESELGRIVAEEAVDAIADDLGQPPDPPGDDRRAAGERLDGDQPERLRPGSGHERCVRLREEAVALGLLELAEELDRRAGRLERRHEDLVEVVTLGRGGACLRRDPQRATGRLGDLDRLDDALLGRHPTDEAERIAAPALER